MTIDLANEALILWMLKVAGILAALIVYKVSRLVWLRAIERIASFRGMRPQRVASARRAVHLVGRAALVGAIVLIISIQFHGLTILLGTIATAIGIAFFARWSIISNVTTSFIIFLRHPVLIGDRIDLPRVANCGGVVKEMTLFYIILVDEAGRTITIPNNLALSQPMVITHQPPPEGAPNTDAGTGEGPPG